MFTCVLDQSDGRPDEVIMSRVYSGWATKRGGFNKSWKRRYFVLTSDGLLSYYTSMDSYSPELAKVCVCVL